MMNGLTIAVGAVGLIAATATTWQTDDPTGRPATQIVNDVAVSRGGVPANGYAETGSGDTVVDCTQPSPAAVSADIYGCAPTAADADVCWPAQPRTDLLCMDDPWTKHLHRVHARGSLPAVTPRALPKPVGLLLDDGTHCRLRNGGAWNGRNDGYLGAYRCDADGFVLALVNTEPVDRSTPLWTVKVGDLPGAGQPAQPPVDHSVTTAWFAGS